MKKITVGDVFMVDFARAGNAQRGYRPAVVISNNKGNLYSPDVIVIPITTAKKKIHQPTHVQLDAIENGLVKDSMALCENPVTVPKTVLRRYCTHLSDDAIQKIAVAHLASTSALAYLDMESMQAALELSLRLKTA